VSEAAGCLLQEQDAEELAEDGHAYLAYGAYETTMTCKFVWPWQSTMRRSPATYLSWKLHVSRCKGTLCLPRALQHTACGCIRGQHWVVEYIQGYIYGPAPQLCPSQRQIVIARFVAHAVSNGAHRA
jgi:hypothetical protein